MKRLPKGSGYQSCEFGARSYPDSLCSGGRLFDADDCDSDGPTEDISHRKTKRAERITGFDQAPDFIIPNEFNPQIVIEAKITEDDGTARDKVTRVQHLGELSTQGLNPGDPPRFEVVACIAGRGFKVRREDMKKLILATRGKVFTLQTLARLIDCTRLGEYKTK